VDPAAVGFTPGIVLAALLPMAEIHRSRNFTFAFILVSRVAAINVFIPLWR
jgi:hypothetical protein